MTLKQMQARLELLEREVVELKRHLNPRPGAIFLSGFGEVGAFANDPTFEDAARIGREYRQKVNEESLREMDRDLAAAPAEKPAVPARKKKARPARAGA